MNAGLRSARPLPSRNGGPASPTKAVLADATAALKAAAPGRSAVERRAAASLCQRLTVEQRKPIVLALLSHEEDKDDHNLPLMFWYAAEPIVAADPVWATEALAVCKIPKVTEFIARRMATK